MAKPALAPNKQEPSVLQADFGSTKSPNVTSSLQLQTVESPVSAISMACVENPEAQLSDKLIQSMSKRRDALRSLDG